MFNKSLNKIILSVLFFSLFFGVAVAQEEPRDTTPPTISNVDIFLTSGVNVSVTWNTNEIATSVVRYGLSPDNYEFYGYGGDTLNHIINLNDLSPGKEYFFEIISADEFGNESVVSGVSFSTEDFCSFPPKVLFLNIEQSTNNANLDWETDIISGFVLRYGISGEGAIAQIENIADLSKKHELFLEGLEPNKDYFVEIISTNELGISGDSEMYYFRTLSDLGDGGTSGDGVGETSQPSLGGGSHEHAVEIKEEPCDDPAVIEPLKISDPLYSNKPQNIKAVALDKIIVLSWTLPVNKEYQKIKIIRNDKNYPKDLSDGVVVYDGSAETISDINLINSKTYYYAMYSYDNSNKTTEPVLFSFAPYKETRHFHVLNVSNFNLYDFSEFLKSNLKLGDKNDEVGHLQELLAIDPSIYPEGLVTNYFGPLTENAVKKSQEKAGLALTGQVDEKTREVVILNSVKQKITERNDIVEIKYLSTDMKQGIKGENVSYLQKYLIAKGFLKEGFSTGYFGDMTKKAIIDFQQKNSIIPASGYVGQKTRAKILEDIKITDYLK
ncbi:MAG TPA: peptidoglycan-binding protein [Candidatus Paceibacterota bacterium]|nr:peptidoglycan-binding protein [Candidatus Paceibacterota bacterium]